MLTPRLTNCPECPDILGLIEEIDCKITELSKGIYNNIIFALNTVCKTGVMSDLLIYRNILVHRYCNGEYASKFSTQEIASKVKLLIYK